MFTQKLNELGHKLQPPSMVETCLGVCGCTMCPRSYQYSQCVYFISSVESGILVTMSMKSFGVV